MRHRYAFAVLALTFGLSLATGACRKHDNSDVTAQASKDLRLAQEEASQHGKALVANQADMDQSARDLIAQNQKVADNAQALAKQQVAVGSAQLTLAHARLAYTTAMTDRLARLDADLTALAGKATDAKAKDALAGLRARRDAIVSTWKAATATVDANWETYTRDIDSTLTAIEHDLRDAK